MVPLGVIWDLDGVLVDTGEYHWLAWQEALADYGLSMTYAQFRATFGMLNRDILGPMLGERATPELIQAIGDHKEACFRRLIQGRIRPLPGVRHWLEFLAAAGCGQAIASSAPPDNIAVLLEALGIRPFFQAVISAEGMPGKPAPDVFLAAARALGLPPARCVVIEDAVSGVAGARAAGMKCIAVTTTNPDTALAAADLIVPDLTAVEPQVVWPLLGVAPAP
jgi:beta-phosphoglucomutase family hydrolase